MTDSREQHTIDATGKRLGRVATEVAHILMGKHRPDVAKNLVHPVSITVTNAHKLLIDERKRNQKTYDRYSGHPGGRTVLRMSQVIDKKGYTEIVRRAVFGMLPGNRLRALRMKQLTVTE